MDEIMSLAERDSAVLPCWRSQANIKKPWPCGDQHTWLQPRRELPPAISNLSRSADLQASSSCPVLFLTCHCGTKPGFQLFPHISQIPMLLGTLHPCCVCAHPLNPIPHPVENAADYLDAGRIRWSHGYESLNTVSCTQQALSNHGTTKQPPSISWNAKWICQVPVALILNPLCVLRESRPYGSAPTHR